MAGEHELLTGTKIHEAFHYVQTSDPGAVGTGKYWLDTTSEPYIIKRRNAGDTGWIIIGLSGDVSGPASATDNALARFNDTGGKTIQNSGVTLDDNDNMTGNLGSLSGFKGAINAQTGTTYTTQDSDHGKIITLSNASPITLTIHQAAPAGFNCLIIQIGAGQVTVAAGGTGNVRNYNSHTKLTGQYAMGSIFVVSNAGTAPEVYLAGNTGT